MSDIEILREFRTNLVKFIDELIEQYPEQPEFIISRIYVSNSGNVADMVNFIIQNIFPHKEEIKNRNSVFFLKNDSLFGKYDKDKVEFYKRLWKTLDKEDQNVMWLWFDLFVHISEKYQKRLIA